MVDFSIREFLFCHVEENGKVRSHKCWGYVEVEGRLFNFWGRVPEDDDQRKHLSFKYNPGRHSDYDLMELATRKVRGGGKKSPYQRISSARDADGQYPAIETVYPNFVRSFKGQLTMARLSDNVLNMGRLAHGS